MEFQILKKRKKYQSRISIESEKIDFALSITFLAFLDCRFRVKRVDNRSIHAYSTFSWKSVGEEVSAVLTDGHLVFTSYCRSLQLLDWGKNRQNFDRFLRAFTSIEQKASIDLIETVKTQIAREKDLDTLIAFGDQTLAAINEG